MFRKRMTILVVVIVSLAAAIPVLALAPSTGTVVEGVSVPGVALGDSRAQVEAAWGQPESCQNLPYYYGPPHGLNGICKFDVEGVDNLGDQVTVSYFNAEGGPALDSPDDVAFNIRWQQAVSGWKTTAGINSTLALADRQAVVDAYPNAEVSYHLGGAIAGVHDPELGISLQWSFTYLGGPASVSMSIFNPYTPPPPPDMIRVADIEMTVNRRSVTARVLVVDDQDQPVEGALVEAAWYYPRVDGLEVTAVTEGDGYATFTVDKARRGNYYLYINNVSLDGFEYDYISSTTVGVTSKTK
jgi:hypothetical protein